MRGFVSMEEGDSLNQVTWSRVLMGHFGVEGNVILNVYQSVDRFHIRLQFVFGILYNVMFYVFIYILLKDV